MIDSKFDVYHFSMTNKLFIILVILEVMFFWGINKEYSGSYLSMMQKVSSNIGIIITPIGFLYLLVRKIRTGDFVINQKGVIDEASDVRIGFIPWEHIERICVSHSAPYFMKHFRLFPTRSSLVQYKDKMKKGKDYIDVPILEVKKDDLKGVIKLYGKKVHLMKHCFHDWK